MSSNILKFVLGLLRICFYIHFLIRRKVYLFMQFVGFCYCTVCRAHKSYGTEKNQLLESCSEPTNRSLIHSVRVCWLFVLSVLTWSFDEHTRCSSRDGIWWSEALYSLLHQITSLKYECEEWWVNHQLSKKEPQKTEDRWGTGDTSQTGWISSI